MPDAPDHFARCSEINRAGPALMQHLMHPAPLDPQSFANRIQAGDAVLLDVRSYPAFSGIHIPGSWHIDLAGNFAIQAGWIIPPSRDILLVVEEGNQVEEATIQLRRVGLDRVAAFLDGGMLAWGVNALPVANVPIISPEDAHNLVKSNQAVIIDVRSIEEMTADHVDGSIHIPWHDLRFKHADLDPENQYIVMCKGGQRASIASSILKMHGFNRVSNLAGGFFAYKRAGFVI
jgi:hydroxyacylglutathione hydrolase